VSGIAPNLSNDLEQFFRTLRGKHRHIRWISAPAQKFFKDLFDKKTGGS
jgi:hypothetical protein